MLEFYTALCFPARTERVIIIIHNCVTIFTTTKHGCLMNIKCVATATNELLDTSTHNSSLAPEMLGSQH